MHCQSETHPGPHLAEIVARYSDEELRLLSTIKRMLECVVGDPDFRSRLFENIDTPQTTADRYGLELDMAACRPLFDRRFDSLRFSDAGRDWPLSQLWDRYETSISQFKKNRLHKANAFQGQPKFYHWRQQQVDRLARSVGPRSGEIPHLLWAVELSQGCTIGCSFCGVSAGRFDGAWRHTPENAMLWRDILGHLKARFGQVAAGQSLCFWATDPLDNPDFPLFLDDFAAILGCLPQSTIAAPLRNLDLTRAILNRMAKQPAEINRLSVLSLAQLGRLHRLFTSEELLLVELIPQYSGSLIQLARAGRARLEPPTKNQSDTTFPNEQTTIACVTGFLIRPMQQSVELISPTPASEQHPLGYKIFGQESFRTGEQFSTAIDGLIETAIP